MGLSYLINIQDAPSSVPAIRIGPKGQVIIYLEGAILIEDSQFR